MSGEESAPSVHSICVLSLSTQAPEFYLDLGLPSFKSVFSELPGSCIFDLPSILRFMYFLPV